MNILQAVKMALKSIWGKKGRSTLTILGIFIGIAAVMTIVSVMEGMKELTRQQYEAMGSNRVTVYIWSNLYDENGNSLAPDYFPKLYEYCNGLKDQIEGVTPEGYANNITVTYGTKSTANMGYEWDENGNPIGDTPPNLYYASDQYSICNNLTMAKGRDLAYLDMTNYNQVCVMGAQAAKTFFGSGNPVGQELQVNGNPFLVVGVYGSRLSDQSTGNSNLDNFIAFPYTARRLLGGEAPSQFTVKAKSGVNLEELVPILSGYVKGLVASGESSEATVELLVMVSWYDYAKLNETREYLRITGDFNAQTSAEDAAQTETAQPTPQPEETATPESSPADEGAE